MILDINGVKREVNVDPDVALLTVLRDHLDLTGSKYGCGEGACGACTVLINDNPTRSCITPVGNATNKEIITIEGLEKNGKLHAVQEAFLKTDAFQCSYCASGMIMSVAALDNDLQVAYFSCGGINLNGGQVDIAAPGVDIYSSWKGKKYVTISGTSMATPFVAGIAALLWERYPKATAAEIWMKLAQQARRLNLPSTDVGTGLAQCF